MPKQGLPEKVIESASAALSNLDPETLPDDLVRAYADLVQAASRIGRGGTSAIDQTHYAIGKVIFFACACRLPHVLGFVQGDAANKLASQLENEIRRLQFYLPPESLSEKRAIDPNVVAVHAEDFERQTNSHAKAFHYLTFGNGMPIEELSKIYQGCCVYCIELLASIKELQ